MAMEKSNKKAIQVCSEAGIHTSAFSLFLNGWRAPNERQKEAIASALGCHADEIFPRI